MKNCLVLLTLAFSFPIFSQTQTDKILSIGQSAADDTVVIRFESGRVAMVDEAEAQKLRAMEALKDSRHEISPDSMKSFSSLNNEEPPYTPSVISQAEATNLFNRMNRNYTRKSECSDRAHVWTYDEFERNSLNGQKAFIFFTDAYIKRTGFKWWFHVAPMYDVQTSGGVQKMVFDYMYMGRPAPVSEWKNLMVHSKRECVTEFNFNDYNAGADQTQDCYMKFSSMYYHFPAEIGARENGTYRSEFNPVEVKSTRARAFHSGSL
jgi:hypothetical protein